MTKLATMMTMACLMVWSGQRSQASNSRTTLIRQRNTIGGASYLSCDATLPKYSPRCRCVGASTIRGGAAASPWSGDDALSSSGIVPSMKLDHVALALRWTVEMNRRLHAGTSTSSELPARATSQQHQHQHKQQPHLHDPIRGGGGGVATISFSPSRMGPSILDDNEPVWRQSLTLFHVESPVRRLKAEFYSQQRCGAARWGPDLVIYLLELADQLGLGRGQPSSLEWALALMYLDRACSVETPRSDGGAPTPYCTPRTVHRLVLAAVLTAVEAVRGAAALRTCYSNLESSWGIPPPRLHQLAQQFKSALGDPGTFVSVDQMRHWTATWESRFGGVGGDGGTGTLGPF